MITGFAFAMTNCYWVRRPLSAKKIKGNEKYPFAVVQRKGWTVARFVTDGSSDEQDAELAILLCEVKFKEEL